MAARKKWIMQLIKKEYVTNCYLEKKNNMYIYKKRKDYKVRRKIRKILV